MALACSHTTRGGGRADAESQETTPMHWLIIHTELLALPPPWLTNNYYI